MAMVKEGRWIWREKCLLTSKTMSRSLIESSGPLRLPYRWRRKKCPGTGGRWRMGCSTGRSEKEESPSKYIAVSCNTILRSLFNSSSKLTLRLYRHQVEYLIKPSNTSNKQEMTAQSFLIKCVVIVFFVLLAGVYSKPTSEAIVGSPYLFHEYDYPVDPHRSAKLSSHFQAANGVKGANLIAYFGTGGLRSVERPAPVRYHK